MKHIKRHIRWNVKAISPVLAVLMMIAVAVAGSLVIYAWVMGYIDLSAERSGQAILIQSIANDATDTDLLVFVQNIGEGVVQLEQTTCLYINGEIVNCTITGVTVSDNLATLNKGDTATLTYLDGAALPGQKVTAKVTTLLGTSEEAYEYPAGSARATPEFSSFVFSTIESPQISGVPFTIKIEAQDQYGETIDYIGTNALSYSGGSIDPIETTMGFINGVWEHEVTVTGSAENGYITTVAQSDPSWVGTSNTFEVDAPVMFVSAGTGGKDITVGNPTINIPPTYPPDLEAGDLILLQIGIRDMFSTLNTPAGFTPLYGPDYAGDGRQWIYYKFSDGTEAGLPLTISVSGSYESVISIMYAFRYVAPFPFAEDPSITADDASTIDAPTVTASPRGLALAFIYAMDNQEIGDFEDATGGDWTVLGNVPGEASMSDSDAIIVTQFAEMFDGGTISGGDVGRVGVRDENWVIRAFALIPKD